MNAAGINTVADAKRYFAASKAQAATAGETPQEAKAREVKMAAQQFEAIIVRQLLAPAIEPMMDPGKSGGAEGSGGSGGGVYGFMLTDVLANSISQGGGLGFSKLLQSQLTPKGHAAAAQVAAAYGPGKVNAHE